MATIAPTSYSRNGEYLVHSSADGVIKIWETETGVLRQEYTPSSHLSAACTCLVWCPTRTSEESPRKKKKKRSRQKSESGSDADLIALGTTSGAVLLYSYLNGDLQTQLESSHADRINDVCWSPDGEDVFACSNDHHITQWDVSSTKVKHKWKADKGIVHSVCCSHQYLISAGRSIKLWNLSTKTVVQTFTGHSTEVFRLLPVPKLLTADGDSSAIDSSYFLSAALNDRLINVWHVNPSSKTKSAVASFTLPDEPCMLDLSRSSAGDQPILLAVVTRGGQLLIFEHILNGTLKRPLQAKFTIQCATLGDKDSVPRPMTILAAALVKGTEPSVLLAYGSFLKPTFEKVVCNGQSDICLVREDSLSGAVKVESSLSKVKTPDVSKEVTELAPGVLVPSRPTQEEPSVSAKRKKRKPSASEMTMEDRLNAISIDQSPGKAGTAPPKADALALLLTQGLQSQDKLIVNNVLQIRNDMIIRNTVKRLPAPMVIPLVKELSQRIQGHAQSGHTLLKWIKTLLTIHTSYLMTFPELVDKFSGMYEMMTSRVTMFSNLSRLQGKLNLVLSQIKSQDQEGEDTTTQQALLVYEDNSSDDEGEVALDDLMAIHSESEDNWEDLSDMEAVDGGDDNGKDMEEEDD
ncbi:WD repeat-containing protein 43-like isoform X2 [Liolophura sinensis]|uniref:WD repeat-containing protein 43-like isoform X2 n=1 Tax=Liolophura sinensis TaxID=3198878 RepID=UPI00315885A5